jgi:sugar lactone lactonase YvrE
MKKKISFPKISPLRRALQAGSGIALLSICLLMPAPAQTNYPDSFTFVTLAGKPDAASLSAGDWTPFSHPKGLAVDSAGNVYVANTRNHTIYRLAASGVMTVLAGRPGSSGSADGIGGDARFRYPQGIAVDGSGNVFVADSGNNTIRRITPDGRVTTLAGRARLVGSADGTGDNARFNYPNSVAVDKAGNVYVADLYNAVIRKVTSQGVVTTLAGLAGDAGSADGKGAAARFNFPVSVAVDPADNVYVADINNNAIRKITPAGIVTTLAGKLTYDVGSSDGTGIGAQFCNPTALTVDDAGNVYVADTGNQTIRRITSSGEVTTLAGVAGQGGNQDGTGNGARFRRPMGIAMDHAGNLYVADQGNGLIRKGSFTGATGETASALSPVRPPGFSSPPP